MFTDRSKMSLGPQVEAGSGLGHEGHRTQPADILIPHRDLGKPAALDLTVTSTLNSSTLYWKQV